MENEILRDALAKAQAKKTDMLSLPRDGSPMKRVAEVLGVARSNLAVRVYGEGRPRGSYVKAKDEALLPLIRRFVDERPTYGYRRITALVNRELTQQRRPPQAGSPDHTALLLECYTGRHKGRTHEGKIMVMRSNLRWCSDGLEFTCWNGEIIRMAFIIDAFDREIIACTAVCGAGISGSDVRDMMLEAVEKRFKAMRAPHPIEHLSDNDSPYTAKETRDFAAALNLVPCFTPVRSPESNGMAEAFVKTLKRDYLRVNPLPDAHTVLRQIAGWIDDYNEIHPHSALRMRSPREFIRAQTQ